MTEPTGERLVRVSTLELFFDLVFTLTAGAALFVAADAAMLRVLGVAQTWVRAAASVAVLITIPLGAAVSAALQVAAIAAIIAAALAVDRGSTGMLGR